MRAFAKKVLGSAAMMRTVRRYTHSGIRILAYHRFPQDPSGLVTQCRHILRYFHPITMREIANKFAGGATLPRHALAVTVDDGYQDFLLHGYPVFSQHGIPVTVFLITDFIDGTWWPWWDRVRYIFDRTRRSSFEFNGTEVTVGNDRRLAAHKVFEVLKSMPQEKFYSEFRQLQQFAGVDAPPRAVPEYEALSWDEVRRLAQDGVEFGVHTKTHPVLSQLSGLTQLRGQIAGAKDRVEKEMAVPSIHFCYPYGTRADYNETTVALVKESGFLTAVTAECGFNYSQIDPFQLLRVVVEPSMPAQFFAELLAGVRSHNLSQRRALFRTVQTRYRCA